MALASRIMGESSSLNLTQAAAVQRFDWGTFEVERYRNIAVRWRQHNDGGWECEFRNDNDSKVRIYYTVNYINSNGKRRHKRASSVLDARSTGAGTFVRDAKNQPRIHYRELKALK
jgi:hypothetical protein